MDINQIRSTIAGRRKEKKLSQKQLSLSADMTREAVSRFETDANDIGLRRLQRLCAALDLEICVRPGRGRPIMEDLDQIFSEEA